MSSNRRSAEHVLLWETVTGVYIELFYEFKLSPPPPLLPLNLNLSLFFYPTRNFAMKASKASATVNPRGRGPYNVACDACARK